MKTRITQIGHFVVPDLELDGKVGVYRIYGPSTKSYVGSSINLQKRARDHWRDFQCGTSPSAELKQLVEEIGFECLAFEVLEYLPDDTPKWKIELLDAEERIAREYAARGELLNAMQIAMTWSEEKRNQQRKDGKFNMTPHELRLKIRGLDKQLKYFTKKLEELERGPLEIPNQS